MCAAGSERACTVNGQPGVETCTAEFDNLGHPSTYWGGCEPTGPAVPQPETCNGLDDDLDGVIDNAPGQGANTLTRAYSNPNACAQNGTERCTGPNTWAAPTGCGGASNTTCAASSVPDTCAVPKVQCNDACQADTASCFSDLLWCGDFSKVVDPTKGPDFTQYKLQQCMARVTPGWGQRRGLLPRGSPNQQPRKRRERGGLPDAQRSRVSFRPSARAGTGCRA